MSRIDGKVQVPFGKTPDNLTVQAEGKGCVIRIRDLSAVQYTSPGQVLPDGTVKGGGSQMVASTGGNKTAIFPNEIVKLSVNCWIAK